MSSGIKRTRPSHSCGVCRTRRVKCDLQRPSCSNCVKNDVTCVYPTTSLKRQTPSVDISERTNKNFRNGHMSVEAGGRSRWIMNTFWACLDEESLEIDTLLSELPLFPLEAICCQASDELGRSGHHYSCRHYVGTTEPNFSFWSSPSHGHGNGRDSRTLASILSHVPPKPLCDRLYSNFLSAVHPLAPMLHIPTFNDQYDRFWEWFRIWDFKSPPQGVLTENPSLLPLMFAILFTGAAASSVKTGDIPPKLGRRQLQLILNNTSNDSLTLVGFPHNPSMYSLIAFLLLRSLEMQEEESLSSISFVSVAFRIAQAMGLHNDGSTYGMDHIQGEERQRVWCYILHLDVNTSIISGLPMIAHPTLDTCRPISECRDTNIKDKQTLNTPPTTNLSNLYPGYVLAAGRYDASSCIRVILNQHASPNPMQLSEIQNAKRVLQKLRERTYDRLDKLSAITQWHPLYKQQDESQALAPTDDAFRTLGASLLNLTVEKAYCMLYHPLMKDPQVWSTLRHEGIASFQGWLRIFLQICDTNAYGPFQWLYPGTYQPLQSVAALLQDLMREPNSDEASESRLLLERVFSMVGPDGRVSGNSMFGTMIRLHASRGAKEAWMRLEKLRRKVWSQLGLDPNVMWTRSLQPSIEATAGANLGRPFGPEFSDTTTNSMSNDPIQPNLPPSDTTMANTSPDQLLFGGSSVDFSRTFSNATLDMPNQPFLNFEPYNLPSAAEPDYFGTQSVQLQESPGSNGSVDWNWGQSGSRDVYF